MIKWYPKAVEVAEHHVSNEDYEYALERVAKVLYLLHCRLEISRPFAPTLLPPSQKECR